MKKFNHIGISLITMGLLVGCGSNSGTTPETSSTTGTGYYVDNAVKGIKYICGTQIGTTDQNGKFTFEKGKKCTFSLAGITLRTTPSQELTDGKEIVENDLKVAKFLQSIDSDNDLTNGIQISDAVLNELTTALKQNNSENKLPEGPVLQNVVSYVGDNVEGVTGNVRTDDQVKEHLAQTQIEITKKLLSGKIFYVPYTDHNVNVVEKHTVNADATHGTWEQVFGQSDSGTDTISISGDIVTFDSGDNGKRFSILNVTDKYMEIKDADDDEIEKIYFSLEDAKATFDSATSSTTAESINPMVLANKTIYFVSDVMIESDAFNSDVSSVTWKNIHGKGDSEQAVGNTGTAAININQGHIVEMTDTYVIMSDENNESRKYYLNYDDALAYYNTLQSDTTSSNTTSTLSDLIVGKTYYATTCDSYEENGQTINNNHVETLLFGSDGKVYDTWIENAEEKESILSYSIDGETMTVITPNNETLTLSNVEQADNYIFFTTDGKFYTSKSVAESNLNDDCSN